MQVVYLGAVLLLCVSLVLKVMKFLWCCVETMFSLNKGAVQ